LHNTNGNMYDSTFCNMAAVCLHCIQSHVYVSPQGGYYGFFAHFFMERNEARETHTSKEVCYGFYVHFFMERNEPKNHSRDSVP